VFAAPGTSVYSTNAAMACAIVAGMNDADFDDDARRAVLRERARQWRANNKERAAQIAKASRDKAAREAAIAEGRDPDAPRVRQKMSDEERRAKRKVLDDRNNAIKKAAAAAQALAEGREPGRVGRPALLTPEEKEASRVKQNRRRTLRGLEKRTAKRAERAIAGGRIPGKTGGPRILTDEQRAENRKQSYAKWRNENIDVIRARDAETAREKRALKAIAEGRVPGVLGHLSTYSAEDFAAYMVSWPDRNDVFHNRLKVGASRAKRLGIPGTVTLLDLRRVCEEQVGHCAFCAKPFGDETPEIDHWVALAAGGTNTPDNIRLLHPKCNRTKGARLPSDYGLPDEASLLLHALNDDAVPAFDGE
jgi:5-methylcytosine-specific restriction endonuclease McrA